MEFRRGTSAAPMQPERLKRGEMSQDLPTSRRDAVVSLRPEVMPRRPAIDPAARKGKSAFESLSASSVGLELGISVILGLLVGYGLDAHYGTGPWLMLLFLGLGLVAGFRGVLRAVNRMDRAAEREAREATRGG
jgi:ATP synthase protein I